MSDVLMEPTATAAAPLRPSRRGRKATGLRPRGTGGIVAVRPGVWRIDIEISRDPVTGRRRRVSRRVRGTRDDAEAALAKLRVADHDGRLPRPGTAARTVRAALDDYVDAARAGIVEMAPKTVVTTRSAATTMRTVELPDGRVFGDIALSKLRWEDIELLYQTLRQAGRSAAPVRRKATVLAQALDRARKRGLLDHNPARDAARPKLVRTKPHSPAAAEVDAVVAAAATMDAEIADAVVILAGTGMRMGELLGLQWTEVDLSILVVVVCWSITDGGPGVGILRKPTKRSDWRDVPLTTAASAALRRQAQRNRERFALEPGQGHYVFPGLRGPDVPHRPDTFGDRWVAARGESPTTFQHLRHYVATTMLDAGEDYRTVADILGNSETTLRLHYDGRTNLDKRRAISALER